MTLTTAGFDWVCSLVRAEAGIELQAGKEYLVESRLAPLARAAGRPDVASYVDQVRSSRDRAAFDKLVEALTTNETSWFRDGGPFTTLEKEIVPQLLKTRASTRAVSVWSAASSTGQEPYSIAMILRDTLPAGWQSSILGTDLSPSVLAQARSGLYSQLEVNRGLPVNRLVTHFTREGTRWKANEDIRRMVTFKQMNLARPFPSMGQYDVVFLRNVLIYFSLETRREILKRVRQVCRPDAYLLLGGAETTIGVDPSWERIQVGSAAVYRPKN